VSVKRTQHTAPLRKTTAVLCTKLEVWEHHTVSAFLLSGNSDSCHKIRAAQSMIESGLQATSGWGTMLTLGLQAQETTHRPKVASIRSPPNLALGLQTPDMNHRTKVVSICSPPGRRYTHPYIYTHIYTFPHKYIHP